MDNLFIFTGLRWLWLTIIVCITDLSTNYIVSKNLFLMDTIQIFPFLNLSYVRNYGAAFSFFINSGGWQWWLFVSISSIICIILFSFMYHAEASQKLKNISYALIIGGALSNLFERLWYGFVIDIIDFYINSWHFATFNIADSAICIGTILLLFKEIFLKIDNKEINR